jgi:hypothetical protein
MADPALLSITRLRSYPKDARTFWLWRQDASDISNKNSGDLGTGTGVDVSRDTSWKNQSGARNESSGPCMGAGTKAQWCPGRYVPRVFWSLAQARDIRVAVRKADLRRLVELGVLAMRERSSLPRGFGVVRFRSSKPLDFLRPVESSSLFRSSEPRIGVSSSLFRSSSEPVGRSSLFRFSDPRIGVRSSLFRSSEPVGRSSVFRSSEPRVGVILDFPLSATSLAASQVLKTNGLSRMLLVVASLF